MNMTQNSTDKKTSVVKKITQGTIMAIIALVVGVFLTDPVQNSLFPPEPDIRIISLTADNGNISGKFPNYVYSPSSYPANGIFEESFHLTLTNDGDGNANNFKILFRNIPKTNWLDFKNITILNSNLPNICPNKSNECSFELLSKQLGPVQLVYDVTLNVEEFKKIIDSEPVIQIDYDYEKILQINPIYIKIKID